MKKIVFFLTMICLLLSGCFYKSSSGNDILEKRYKPITMSIFDDSVLHARRGFRGEKPPYPIYNNYQIAGIAETMLILQNEDGGWPKNVDWFIKLNTTNIEKVRTNMILNGEGGGKSTFDNRTTYSHIDYLANVYSQIPNEKYKSAIEKAINWIFTIQNNISHGFTGIDVDAVTYNDDVMTGVLRTLKEISSRDDLYSFLDNELREKASVAYTQGLDCILLSQVRVNGKLMAWGQQHDHETLEPIWARDYEPPSITANESVGIIELLMEIENPSQEIIRAVCAACEWLDKVRIKGKKLVWKPISTVKSENREMNYEKTMEDDSSAPDLWCRFYDIKTELPLLYDWGRKKVNNFNDLSIGRRNGYYYFGVWPELLLEKAYPQWRKKNGLDI